MPEYLLSAQASQQRMASPRASSPVLVPFIARWSGERDGPMPVVVRRGGRGIAYADERTYDRDADGVLWSRAPSQTGRGRPEFGVVHSLRQRMCMAGVRCQVCGGPADRTAAGVLWVIDAPASELKADGEETAHPPVCAACALLSVRACPHLRKAVVAVRVRDFAPVGVNGVFHRPTREGPATVGIGRYRFGDPRTPWVRAHQLIVGLHGLAPVDLGELRP